MPRFNDEWVVTKTLFEYQAGGQCICCAFPTLFDPNGLKGLINSISDLETDAANDEYNAAQNSPWPPEMRDSVWADRARVRHKMKKEIADYKELIEDIDDDELRKFCVSIGAEGLMKMFQLSRSEIADMMGSRYNSGEGHAYYVIVCAATEQVANFKLTKYEPDARGNEEIQFEKVLQYDRFGGFMIDIAKEIPGEDILEIDHEVLNIFLTALKTIGGPKLLQRGPSTSNRDCDEEGDADDVPTKKKGSKGPSFRSDRRLVRLMILRYWSEQIINKFKIERSKSQQ